MEQEKKEEEERRDSLEKQTYTFQCELAPRAGFKKWNTPLRGHAGDIASELCRFGKSILLEYLQIITS